MRVNESQSQRPAQAQPRVSPNWQRVQRPPSPSLQLHCTAPLLPGLLLVPPPLSAAPVAEAVRLLALVVRPEGDPTDGRTEADGRWRWDQGLPHNDLGPAMSDVTTYLVTNQITPTPPLPHAARHRHVPVHCTAVHTACAAVCVSNFLFDCHSCPSAPHLAHTPPALVICRRRTPFTAWPPSRHRRAVGAAGKGSLTTYLLLKVTIYFGRYVLLFFF